MKRIAVVVALLTLSATSVFAGPIFLRGGFGLERARDVTLRDVDCASTNPPALFGCGSGNDGRDLAARGDFDNAEVLQLGVGMEFGHHGLVELLLAHRAGMEFEGEANFNGVSGDQPVRAKAHATTAMLNTTWIMGKPYMHARPYLTVGGGLARNKIDSIAFGFPGISQTAITEVKGGNESDFAWTAGAGVAYAMTDTLSIDLGLNYTSLGHVKSEAGEATIVRPSGTTHMNINGLESDLDTIGIAFSVRWRPAQ